MVLWFVRVRNLLVYRDDFDLWFINGITHDDAADTT